MPPEQPRHLALVADHRPHQANTRERQRPRRPRTLAYPELVPVLSCAMSAVMDALQLGADPPQDVIGELEHAAATAMTDAYAPIAAAASRLAAATAARRATEAATVRKRAEETAALVAETAATLQQRHDRLAVRMAAEAAAVARLAAAASVPGLKFDARKRARQEADAVREAAAARADRRAASATQTAAAAEQAAAKLALEAEHAAATVARDAEKAAAAVLATALEAMYEIAVHAACRRYLAIPTPPSA